MYEPLRFNFFEFCGRLIDYDCQLQELQKNTSDMEILYITLK